MTDKEKAYDEALKKASATHKDEDRHLKATLERIFPELKENDDEKMRNFIINELACLRATDEKGSDRYEELTNAISWLEKQCEPNPYSGVSFKYNGHTWGMCGRDGGVEILVDGKIKERILLYNKPKGKSALEAIKEEQVDNELVSLCSNYSQKLYNPSNSSNTEKNEQKSDDKIEPRFKVGDWVVFIKSNSIYQVEKKENYEYTLRHILGSSLCLPFSNEELIRKWTINDAKDGDVLALSWLEDKNLWEKIIIFKKYHNEGVKGLYSMPCVEGYGKTFKNGKIAFLDEEVPYYSKTWTCNLHPATKEQRNLLFQKMKDAGYE